MSSRNPFVTSFIYWAQAIEVVADVLSKCTDPLHFHGRKDNAGYFCGRMDTISPPPLNLEDILAEIDQRFAKIEYEVHFDIAIVCDDAKMVLQRIDPYGLEMSSD